jgi:uncharacterized protein YjiS (DUF1127 family)
MLHSLTEPASTFSSIPLAGKIRTVIALVWQTYQHRRRQRATVRLLRELDERTLNDIGLSRSEIEATWLSDQYRREKLCD